MNLYFSYEIHTVSEKIRVKTYTAPLADTSGTTGSVFVYFLLYSACFVNKINVRETGSFSHKSHAVGHVNRTAALQTK